MREPQPSHVGRSWRACQGSSFRPRAEEGERHPMASATQAQGEIHEGQSQQGPFSKGTARDRLQRRIFCPFLPLGRGFVCLLFWFSFCNIFAPQRDTQLRETFTPAPWRWATTSSLLTTTDGDGFATKLLCKWLCWTTSPVLSPAVLENQVSQPRSPSLPVPLLVAGGAQCLASHSIWLLL